MVYLCQCHSQFILPLPSPTVSTSPFSICVSIPWPANRCIIIISLDTICILRDILNFRMKTTGFVQWNKMVTFNTKLQWEWGFEKLGTRISGGKLLRTVAPCMWSQPVLYRKEIYKCFSFTLKDQNVRNRHDDMSNSFLSIMQEYIVNGKNLVKTLRKPEYRS